MSVLMGQLGGLLWGPVSLTAMLPSPPPLSSVKPLPAPGSTDVNSLALAVCVAPLWPPTPSMEKASDAGGIALDAECAVTLPSGHVPRAPGRSPVTHACFPSMAAVPERTGWSGHVDVPRPQAGCSQDPRRGDESLDPGLCRMCPCRCRL